MKSLDFLLKNLDFLLKNLDFLLKNPDLYIKRRPLGEELANQPAEESVSRPTEAIHRAV